MKYFIVALSITVLAGCGITHKTQHQPRTKTHRSHPHPARTHSNHVKRPNWKVKQEKAPITDDMPYDYGYNLKSEKKSGYDVVLLLPMRANRVTEENRDKIPGSTLRFIQFWAGAKMAIQDLNNEGVHLNVSAKDTRYSEEDAKRIWRDMRSSPPDVVVGPYKRSSVQYYSERAKAHDFTHVSPWISSPKITKNNPFYIQTKAGLRAHYQTIFNHIAQNYDPEQVYIVIKEKDKSKKKLMEEIYSEVQGSSEGKMPHFIEVNVDTVLRGHTMIDSASLDWASDRPLVFFLPYASNKDKMFVYSFMQKFELLSGTNETVLYGLYKWLDFGDGVYDLLNRMDVRLSVSGLVNPFNSATRQFRKRYFSQYGEVPGNDAYEGYDLFYFLGKSLDKFGNKFQLSLSKGEPISRIHTVYDIRPVLNNAENRVEYFENGFVDLIRLEHYNFQRVKIH